MRKRVALQGEWRHSLHNVTLDAEIAAQLDGVELHVRTGAASLQPSQLACLIEATRHTLGLQVAPPPSERSNTHAVYDDAMAAGHGAFLLDQERPNIFTVSVGNLHPQHTIEIVITYVTLLAFEGTAVRLLIPTTVSPRYVPAGPPEVGQTDGEHVNPPAQETVPYGLTLSVAIRDTSMTQIESPSHAIRTTPHLRLSKP